MLPTCFSFGCAPRSTQTDCTRLIGGRLKCALFDYPFVSTTSEDIITAELPFIDPNNGEKEAGDCAAAAVVATNALYLMPQDPVVDAPRPRGRDRNNARPRCRTRRHRHAKQRGFGCGSTRRRRWIMSCIKPIASAGTLVPVNPNCGRVDHDDLDGLVVVFDAATGKFRDGRRYAYSGGVIRLCIANPDYRFRYRVDTEKRDLPKVAQVALARNARMIQSLMPL